MRKLFKLFLLFAIGFIIGCFLYFYVNYKQESNASIENVNMPVYTNNELADKYNPIYEENYNINSDYVAYLEWENDLLYDYDDTDDKYPHIIVKSHMIEDGEGDLNEANNEYLRHNFIHEYKTFGQDFFDASISLDENNLPIDQNLLIYGHNVYNETYKTKNLKFTPLHNLKDDENFDKYDTFTLTFNHQQRTYQITNIFYYDKRTFNGIREESPLALNYTEEQFMQYVYKIKNEYETVVDTGIEISSHDHFVTLQTCVKENPTKLLIVLAKEINRIDF